MKKCKYCQTEIDNKAKVCPNCRKKQGMPTWLKFVIAFVIIMFLIAACSSSDNEPTSENKNTNSTTNETTKKVEKFSYTVDSSYVGDYNVGYYIEGTVTNNRDKDYSYVQIEFVCYDSNGNNIGTAIDNTNNLLGNQTWKYKAIFMDTNAEQVDHCDYHEVTGW